MSKENINLPLIEGIYDIQPIAPPPLNLLELSLVIIFISLVTFTIIYFIWKSLHSNKAVARRKIIKLKRNYLEQRITAHSAIYQLCKNISQGLNLNPLGEKTPISNKLFSQKEKWLNFTKELSLLRYSKREIKDVELKSIFKQSLYWLEIW